MLNCQGLIKKLPQIEQVFLQQNRFFLQQKTVTYSHKKVINLCVVSGITTFYNINSYSKMENALFEAAKLTKNADIHK